jgi:hypothetical protein
MPETYPLPWKVLSGLFVSIWTGRPRSLREDASQTLASLPQPPVYLAEENLPNKGPLLLTCNHYTRSGLPAWWIVLAVSARLPYPVHWVISGAFTFNDHPLFKHLASLTAVLLRQAARSYGFTCMPPMPPYRAEFSASGSSEQLPDPASSPARAHAIRQILRYAKTTPNPVLGLSPEGRDAPHSRLQSPPPGSGRLIAHLVRLGLRVLPVGLYEKDGRFIIHFGRPYHLDLAPNLSPGVLDRTVSDQVMQAVAALLPAHLQGFYTSQNAERSRTHEAPESA